MSRGGRGGGAGLEAEPVDLDLSVDAGAAAGVLPVAEADTHSHGGPVGQAGRPRRRPAHRALVATVSVAVVGAVVAAGWTAHHDATSAAAAIASDTVDVEAAQRVAGAALQAAAPGLPVLWGTASIGAMTDSGAAVDVQRTAFVLGRARAAAGSLPPRVAYRIVTGIPETVARQPCLVPSVRIDDWQYFQGGDQALGCSPTSGPGPGRWAQRAGYAMTTRTVDAPSPSSSPAASPSSPSPSAVTERVAVREVLLVRDGRATAAAAWATGPHAQPPLTAAALRRIVLALARPVAR